MKKIILIVIAVLSGLWILNGGYNLIDTFQVYSQAMRELELEGKTPYMNYYSRLLGMLFSGVLFPASILSTCVLYLKNHKFRKVSLYISLGFIVILLLGIIYSVWAIYQETR